MSALALLAVYWNRNPPWWVVGAIVVDLFVGLPAMIDKARVLGAWLAAAAW